MSILAPTVKNINLTVIKSTGGKENGKGYELL